jgi:endonuclease G, mitochondrial
MKLPIDLLEKAENPDLAEIRRIRMQIAAERPMALDGDEHVERRMRMIAAVAVENVADAFERYIGNNELLPINYLLTGYLQSRSVGLIRYFDRREGKGAVATGFLVSESLLMTNHHVFPVDTLAAFQNFATNPTVEFNFEYDIDGNRPAPVVFALDPQQFLLTSKPLDMALIAVRPLDNSGTHALRSQGYLVLNGNLGKAGVGDFASIIQHPEGHEKQIAIRKNEIISIDDPQTILYASDTAQGSSGAPVFNDQWQVIALHSAGVPRKNTSGEYLDKDNEVIEPVNGYIDEDRIVWESNRGTRVSAMMAHLRREPTTAAHPLIQPLFSPAYTDSRPYAFLSRPSAAVERTVPTALTAPTTVAPVAAAIPLSPISINISITPNAGVVVTPAAAAGLAGPSIQPAFLFEKKFEDELDFSDCAGFDADFMGVYLPMPVPGKALRKVVATLTDSASAYTLKYHHYSTIHHAVRRVPIVSGINVHAKYRYAELDVEGSRVDKWYRDNRIDYDVQLDDNFYKKSGFDRGHLARREDAEWGSSVAKAKLAADLTCSYANAVPQVPALNRAKYGYHGLWGQLEEQLLEKGVENESGKAARICVFNGPMFADDDPIFKGVPVALSFYKVVVWYDGVGKLRTTCYQLSQAKLVGEIEFEVLRFNEIFKTHQVPIGKIEHVTGLKFHDTIVNNDTSTGEEDPIE